MIRFISDTWGGLKGVARALSFREDWTETLDLSASGLVRSFAAAVISLPVLIFILMGYERLNIDNVEDYEGGLSALDILWAFAKVWFVFPILAFVLTRISGSGNRIVHWIVLHNWAVVFLLLIQAFPLTLYLAGLSSAAGVAFSIGVLYEGFRYFVHFRVANVALGLPLLWTIPIAMIPVIASMALAYGFN